MTDELLCGRDVVIISSIDWSDLWQAHQEIASRLACSGSRVVYIENTGTRDPRFGDWRRVVRRLKAFLRARRSGGALRPAGRVLVISPLILPPLGGRLRRLLNRLFVGWIARTLHDYGVRDPIVWTFLPTDTALDIYQRLRTPASRLVYYCVADFPAHAAANERIARAEEALLKEAAVVFANVSELAARIRRSNTNVHVFPVGVSLDAFTPGVPVAAAIRDLPRPRIGCIAELHNTKTDYAFLTALARLRPKWTWIYVGPVEANVDFTSVPNVRLAGHVPHRELASYIEGFDVCIVPYRQSEFMRTAVPTKINEYLAMAKPVVATPSIYAETVAAEGAILVAPHEAGAFVKTIEAALEEDSDRQASRRRLFASRADWQERLAQMCAIVRGTL